MISRQLVVFTESYQEFLFYREKRDSHANLALMTSDSDSSTCVPLITLKLQKCLIDLPVAFIGGKPFTDLA